MKRKYREDLEKAAHQMILEHNAQKLINSILLAIVENLKVSHAGLFIYDKNRKEYVVKVSSGQEGSKIPSGLIKVDKINPLIRYFIDKDIPFKKDFIVWDRLNGFLRLTKAKKQAWLSDFLGKLKANLSLWPAYVCIPGFFRKDLIGVLFLGERKNKRKFDEEDLGYLAVLASDIVMALKNAWLFEDLSRQIGKNEKLFMQTILALAKSIEAKDEYTRGHTGRVVEVSIAIAHSLNKYKKIPHFNDFLENLKIGALLHDIGKIGIPEPVLNKGFDEKGERIALTDKENEMLRKHPALGAEILEEIDDFKEAIDGVKYHHERWDGTGYPYKLEGNKIPLIGLIIAVADAYDAMVIDRVYRKARPEEEVIEEIKRCKGTQFSPIVVDAFLRVYDKKVSKKGKS